MDWMFQYLPKTEIKIKIKIKKGSEPVLIQWSIYTGRIKHLKDILFIKVLRFIAGILYEVENDVFMSVVMRLNAN